MKIDWHNSPRDLDCVLELLDEVKSILHEECFEHYITDMKDIDHLAGNKDRRLSITGVVTKLVELVNKAKRGEIPHDFKVKDEGKKQ